MVWDDAQFTQQTWGGLSSANSPDDILLRDFQKKASAWASRSSGCSSPRFGTAKVRTQSRLEPIRQIAVAAPHRIAEAPAFFHHPPDSPATCHRDDSVEVMLAEIGIEPAEVPLFGWVAEYGLRDDALPSQWAKQMDEETGLYFYIEHDSGTSRWENPLTPYLQRVVNTARLYLKHPTEDFFEEQKVLLWHSYKEALNSWFGPLIDELGQKYYFNSASGGFMWQDPRFESQYMYELESNLLTFFSQLLPQPAELITKGLGNLSAQPDSADHRMRLTSPAVFVALAKQCDHRSVVEMVALLADQLHDVCSDDQEAQRLRLARKTAARRLRMNSVKSSGGGNHDAQQMEDQALVTGGGSTPMACLLDDEQELLNMPHRPPRPFPVTLTMDSLVSEKNSLPVTPQSLRDASERYIRRGTKPPPNPQVATRREVSSEAAKWSQRSHEQSLPVPAHRSFHPNI